MSVPTRAKKSGGRTARRGPRRASSGSAMDARQPLVELARVVLDRRPREHPPLAFRQVFARLASSWMGLIFLSLVLRLDAAWFIGLCAVFLVLVGVLAADHWHFSRNRNARSRSLDPSRNPPSRGESNPPPDRDRPEPDG